MMKVLIAAALVFGAAGANAQTPAPQFPSCDLKAQRALKGDTGGAVRDKRQAHILMRANILQADIGNAGKAGHLTRATVDRLTKQVAAVTSGADRYTKKQGFLSAGETASYDRALDAAATQMCRR